jgi:hypothetical protein
MIMQNNQTPVSQTPVKPQKPTESGKILVQDHFMIRDPKTQQVLVKGRG